MSLIRSAVRRLRSYYHRARLRAFGDQPSWARVLGGFEALVDPSNDVDRDFYLGTFEPTMLKLIARVVREGDTCIDVGAQKGFVSLTLARAVGATGRVISFEPDERACELFRANIHRNKQTVVHVFPFALGDREGSSRFVLSKVLGWSSRFPNELAQTAVQGTVEVKVNSLDEMIARKEVIIDPARLSFVKLDAEGSEPLIIKGMKRLLSASRPVLFVEVNNDSLAAAGSGPQELQSLLQELGFRIYKPEIRPYFHTLRLKPVTDLRSIRLSYGNCTNIVAVHGSTLESRDVVARLTARSSREVSKTGPLEKATRGL